MYLVCVQVLEQVDGRLEVGNNVLLGLVVGEALGLQSADAGAVLVPLVLPERLGTALVRGPVCLHVGQQLRVRLSDNRRNVAVLAARVAVGLVPAIALVRPGDRSLLADWDWEKKTSGAKATGRIRTYHRPWIVHESWGPAESQNWVCSSMPPGELTQQVSTSP